MSNTFDTVTSRNTFGKSTNRRQFLRMMGVGAAAIALGTAGSIQHLAANSSGEYKTTAALNLRSGPATTYSVMLVIPFGGHVSYAGSTQNGFFKVSYGSTQGWAHSDYLVPAGGSNTGDPVIVADRQTTTAVNLRSGPSTGHQVLRVVPGGSRVQISDTVQNGFRYVIHNGLAGWMADQYLGGFPDDQGGNYRTTTTALNLRAEPSTAARILTVMHAGARVQMLHTQAGGFANVNYNGMQGWAHLDYLA